MNWIKSKVSYVLLAVSVFFSGIFRRIQSFFMKTTKKETPVLKVVEKVEEKQVVTEKLAEIKTPEQNPLPEPVKVFYLLHMKNRKNRENDKNR
jgi:hypothetical protein